MVRRSRWVKAAALAAAMLGGASAASAYTSSAVIRAGEGLATKVLASADAGSAQVTLWPGSGLVQGYARSLAAGGDATGFTLTQQSGLHRSRAGELLPSRAESWQLVKGTNETPGNADVRVSLTAPTDPAQSIGTFAGGELRSYTNTTLDASVRDFHINPGASATQEAILGELLLLSAQGRNVTPTLVPTSAGSRIYDVHIPVLDGATIRGGVPAQIEMNAAGTEATLRYMNTCLATNCADPGVDVSMRLAGPGGESAAITWRGPGNFDAPVTVNLTPLVSGCTPNQYTLCPQGGKFKVTLNWRDFAGNTGGGKATALSNESGDYWFFDPTNNEEILKIIDACSYTGNYWVFWKALSNVEMDLSITNTETNQLLTYHNPLGFIPNGHLDTNTIFRCDGTGPTTQHYDTQLDLPPPGTPQLIKYVDPALIAPCVPNGDRAICVQNNRFKIEGSWVDFQGNSGYAHMIKKNEQSGYVWFFSPSNYEGLFKVLDACSFTNNFWVFAAGLTNVEAVLRFTDTWTGTVYEQRNALGTDFPTNLDTNTNFTGCSAVAPQSATLPNDFEYLAAPQLTELLTVADANDVWTGLQTIRARTSVSVNGGEAGHVTGIGYAPSVSPSLRFDGVTIRAFDGQFDTDGLADTTQDPEEHLEAKLALVQTRQGLAYQLTTHPNNTDPAGSGTDVIEIAVSTAAGTLRVNNNGTNRAVLLANDGELSGALQSDAVFDTDARLTYQLLPHMMNTWDCVYSSGFTGGCRNTETVVGPTTTSGTHLLKGYGLHTNGTDNGVIAATVQNTYVSGRLENSPFVIDAAQTAVPADRGMLFWIKHIEPRGEFYTNFSGEGNVRLNPVTTSSTAILYDNSTTDADVSWTTQFPAP